ncbi:MAG: hypothetical protein V2A79_19375 [Planctomycetota bacterium]
MKRSSFSGKPEAWWGWTLAALLVAAACPVAALGADRMVLCEEFTATD